MDNGDLLVLFLTVASAFFFPLVALCCYCYYKWM